MTWLDKVSALWFLKEQCYSFSLLHERLEQFVKFVAPSVLLLVSVLCTLIVIVHHHNPAIVETSMGNNLQGSIWQLPSMMSPEMMTVQVYCSNYLKSGQICSNISSSLISYRQDNSFFTRKLSQHASIIRFGRDSALFVQAIHVSIASRQRHRLIDEPE